SRRLTVVIRPSALPGLARTKATAAIRTIAVRTTIGTTRLDGRRSGRGRWGAGTRSSGMARGWRSRSAPTRAPRCPDLSDASQRAAPAAATSLDRSAGRDGLGRVRDARRHLVEEWIRPRPRSAVAGADRAVACRLDAKRQPEDRDEADRGRV